MTYEFPPYLQELYSELHTWLDNQPDTGGFRAEKVDLDSDTILGVASQFHKLFAAHYFKALAALQEIVTHEVVASWIQDNDKLCVVDVGCGAGAGSAAFIETVRQILTRKHVNRKVHIHIIGIDPTRAALEVNRAVLNRITQNESIPRNLHITHEFLCARILDGALELHARLEAQREIWGCPSLPHTLLLQVNVVRPLVSQAQDVAEAYHQIFVSTPMDRIHVLTIATREAGRAEELRQVQESLEARFQDHQMYPEIRYSLGCTFKNPVHSYGWTRKNKRGREDEEYTTIYHAAYTTVQSVGWERDMHWLAIIDADNLRRAWARTRTALMRESLFDEAEIRLFDRDVASALSRLQRRLIVYAEDLVHPQDQINYAIPKTAVAHRPKGLSRFEEEILSVAIIQAVGTAYAQTEHLYAFRLNLSENSEYLYEFWGEAFNRYVADANQTAQQNPTAIVIRTDIASYFTRIEQSYLVQRLKEKMRVNSTRVVWLLNKVLKKQFHRGYHEPGHGLAQGGVGSGYYANVYLADVDAHFVVDNPEQIHFFRYVDDMVIVVSDHQQAERVLSQLDERLHALNLARSEDKTEIVPAEIFRLEPGLSVELQELSYRCNRHLKVLWVAGCHYHEQLEVTSETFYEFLDLYRERVQALGLVVPVPTLRRKLLKYMKMPFQGRLLEYPIELPEFGGDGDEAKVEWANRFRNHNPIWIEELNYLRVKLATIVQEVLSGADLDYASITRSDNRRMRFAVSRLCQIGLSANALELLVKLLKHAPNQLREPAFVLDCIAIQGHSRVILDLYQHYAWNRQADTYMKSLLLRAMRYSSEPPIELLMGISLLSSASMEERLMATESLLASRLATLSAQQWTGVVNILSNVPTLPPRLKKNFILLMRQVRDRDEQSYRPEAGDDPILYDAYSVEDGYNVFSQFEPDELGGYFAQDIPDDAYEYGEMLTTISY